MTERFNSLSYKKEITIMKALRKLFRPQLYYATYDFVLPKSYYEDDEHFNAVAVFDSERSRDKWVDYEDKYTVDHYLPLCYT